jgi:hypothetical protein
MKDLTPFDFMNAASFSKEDLIRNSDIPEHTEKMYTPYVVNRGFTNFEDTILHANEMNMRHGLFDAAQFDYYKAVSVRDSLNGQRLIKILTLMQSKKYINVTELLPNNILRY